MRRLTNVDINTAEYWDSHQTAVDFGLRQEIYAEIVEGKESVIELGCGLSPFLSKINAKRRVGIDVSPVTTAKAREMYPEVTYILGSATNTRVKMESFEAVVAGEVIEHLENPQTLVDEMKRICKPGGVIVVSTPHLEFEDPEHLWEFDGDDLVSMFGGGVFEVVYSERFPGRSYIIFSYIKPKRAFVTGITGQDGSYLAELLLEKGYEVHGLVRRSSTFNTQRIDHIRDKLVLHYGDMTDPFSLLWALKKSDPQEVYNLAAQSHVQVSWETPWYTAQTTGVGVLNLLEAIRVLGISPKIYQASTSELFSGREEQQDENTVKDPVSPYGTAKLYAFQICKNYREAFKMFICNGILFNHESARRGDNFVTKKIINQAKTGEVRLGNIDASRDWGYAPDYVEAMWLMLQKEEPKDYIIATGETHTVREFIEWVKEELGDFKVVIDPLYIRPHDVENLKGSTIGTKESLGWEAKTKGKDLVKKMIYGS